MQHQVAIHQIDGVKMSAVIRTLRLPAIFYIGCGLSDDDELAEKNDVNNKSKLLHAVIPR